jgi:hypothetical protein
VVEANMKPKPKPKEPSPLIKDLAVLGAQKAIADSRELARLRPELDALEDRLRASVISSIKACLDVEHAARAAEDMIRAAFARLKARAA